MRITRIPFNELTRGQCDAWSELQRAHSTFDSPFFRPEYAMLAAQVVPNVEVAVIESDGGSVGFWPYQREAGNVARPVGMSLCDFQAVVVEPNVDWQIEDLLRTCGLTAWSFDHLIDSQARLGDFHWAYCDSPVVDLSHGFEHYRRQKRQDGSESLEQALRKTRKLEREAGRLRFVPFCDDVGVLESVIEWKRDQYRRIGSVDHLAPSWTRDFLLRIGRFRDADFSGMVSALYAGDRLVAAHLGLRSRRVLHCWFPVYNREFQKYSPGVVFWLLLAQQAEALGIERIDLGKGDERYKQNLKTGDTVLAEGAVDLRPARGAIRRGWWHARRKLRDSPLAVPLRSLLHAVRAVKSGRAPAPPAAAEQTQGIHSNDEALALTCD